MREVDDPLLSALGASNGHHRDEDVLQAIAAAERPSGQAVVDSRRLARRALSEVRHAMNASPALSLILFVLALGLVPSLFWAAWPRAHQEGARAHDPRYASQSGSVSRTRETQIAVRGDEELESAEETCAGIGLDHLAAKYGMAPDALEV